MNKGTEIEKVIAYLEKRKQEGYTHVAITTPDKMYDSSIFYDKCSRKNEGVLRIGSSCLNGTDASVFLVGAPKPGTDATIINAFSGEEAEKIFEKLTSAKNTTPLMSK